MGIDVFWDNDEQTVFLVEFNGDWTWDELNAVLKTTTRISTERGRLLGAILDLRKGLNIPGGTIFNQQGMNQFKELISMSNSGQENGPVVIVGMTGMIKTIFDTVSKLDRNVTRSIHFASSMSEARALMQIQLNHSSASA